MALNSVSFVWRRLHVTGGTIASESGIFLIYIPVQKKRKYVSCMLAAIIQSSPAQHFSDNYVIPEHSLLFQLTFARLHNHLANNESSVIFMWVFDIHSPQGTVTRNIASSQLLVTLFISVTKSVG